ncbi:MAG TPA: hypothetical protein VL598_14505 [Trinickia sp.]|uniref:hypothetical protein n=1 Tax=Trinickia sp. TaxID=2571163 RepID=UPI002C61348E|nr:hypothetical protein [Trinickia sp.]HTI18868.1 hypothetical protein [Trinickia sp.]
MEVQKVDIGALEKAVNTLVIRPRLLRRDYWVSQIDGLLERPSISAADRQRLCALLTLLGPAKPDPVASEKDNVHSEGCDERLPVTGDCADLQRAL